MFHATCTVDISGEVHLESLSLDLFVQHVYCAVSISRYTYICHLKLVAGKLLLEDCLPILTLIRDGSSLYTKPCNSDLDVDNMMSVGSKPGKGVRLPQLVQSAHVHPALL